MTDKNLIVIIQTVVRYLDIYKENQFFFKAQQVFHWSHKEDACM